MLYPETVEGLEPQVKATECCTVATPVPDKETTAGDPVALLAIEMVLFALPATVGWNCAVRVRVCEGESVTGALPPVSEYPIPPTEICEIPTLELPVLVTATFCEVEDVPVVTLPKFRLVGLTFSV